MQFPVLIGDVGGTNARFAIVRDAHARMELFDSVLTGDFPDVQHAINAAVLAKTSLIPKSLVLAAAAPIFGEEYKLTNAPWTIRPHKIVKELRLGCAKFMNDFPAQALGVLALERQVMHKVGGGQFQENATRIVLGPGTSFGVATLVNSANKWTILPAECACSDLCLGTGENVRRELQLQPHLKRTGERLIVESAISGPGLENIYQAICAADGINCKELSAAQISAAYANDPIAEEAVNLFSALLGRIAGNLALTVMAKGGVYVTGGMAHKMLALLEQGSFRHEFENKLPQHELAKTIPTWFVNHENAALEGLANYVRTPERFDLTHACVSFAAA